MLRGEGWWCVIKNTPHTTCLYRQGYSSVWYAAYTGPGPGVGVVNGQPLPSTQYTRAARALPGGGEVDVGNVGMKDSAV